MYMYFLLNMEGVRVLPLCCAYQIQSGFKFILLFLWKEIFRPFFIHAHTFLSTLKNWMVTTDRSCSEGKTICCEQIFTEPTVFGERRGPKTEEHSGLKTQGQ